LVIGGVPNGLTAVYLYAVADAIDYNASLNGNGVILDIKYLLFYKCWPR